MTLRELRALVLLYAVLCVGSFLVATLIDWLEWMPQ